MLAATRAKGAGSHAGASRDSACAPQDSLGALSTGQIQRQSSACCLCGGNDTVVVSRFNRWLYPPVNVTCRGCGLVFLDPMPTDKEINAYYKDQFWLRSQGSDEPTEKTILRAARDGESRLSLLLPLLPSLGYTRYCQRAYGIAMQSAPLADVDFADKNSISSPATIRSSTCAIRWRPCGACMIFSSPTDIFTYRCPIWAIRTCGRFATSMPGIFTASATKLWS